LKYPSRAKRNNLVSDCKPALIRRLQEAVGFLVKRRGRGLSISYVKPAGDVVFLKNIWY